ncbi:MAG: hypothetical protein KDA61_08445 [Planctomycetales bacterium]|nr:hypothetical protein [Planctomycetales bacterium]
MACTTAVAVGLAIATQAPLLWELAIGALWAAGGSWIALGLLYTRGERQAFYVGAALMYTSMWTGFGGQFVQAMRGVVQVLGGGFQGSRALTSTLDLGLVAGAAYANGKFAQWCWKKFFEKAPKSH